MGRRVALNGVVRAIGGSWACLLVILVCRRMTRGVRARRRAPVMLWIRHNSGNVTAVGDVLCHVGSLHPSGMRWARDSRWNIGEVIPASAEVTWMMKKERWR